MVNYILVEYFVLIKYVLFNLVLFHNHELIMNILGGVNIIVIFSL